MLRTAAAESDFVPLALVFAQNAKKAGVKVTIQQDPADTFWDNTWGVAPFTFSSWGYRTFFTQWLQSFVSYNAQETRWNDASQKKASRLVYKAAATGDPTRRKSSPPLRSSCIGTTGATSSLTSSRQSTGPARRCTELSLTCSRR